MDQYVEPCMERGSDEYIESEADRGSAELIEEMQRLLKFLEEWPNRSLKFESYLVMYVKLKFTIEEGLDDLETMQNSISERNAVHNNTQVQCKVQSLCGGAIGLIGVLAAPVSGGLSLALTVGSAANSVHGMAKEYKSKQSLNATAAETMENSLKLQQKLAHCLQDASHRVSQIEQMMRSFSEVRKNVIDISSSETKGCNSGRFVFKVADRVCVPLREVCVVLSGPNKTTTKSSFQTKSLAAENGDKLVKAAATTMQLVNRTVQSESYVTGIGRLAQVTKLSQSASAAGKASVVSSKVAELSGQLLEKSSKGLRMTKDAINSAVGKPVFANTAKAASITSSISKFNVALSALSICTDVYSLATHKGPAQTSEEDDIKKLIAETKHSLDCIDEFVEEAKATYATMSDIVEDFNSKKGFKESSI